LRNGETKTIGLVLPDISNSFYAEIAKIVQEKLYDSGYNTFIVNTNDDNELEKVLMRELIQRSIDGMIISPSNNIQELIPILLETHIPVVFTDRIGDENADYVGLDNENEGKKLIKAFTSKPKKLVAVVPDNALNVSTIKQRIEGIKAGCEEEGIGFDYLDISCNSDILESNLKDAIDSGVDSIIVMNKDCTLPVTSALSALKVKIPGDVRLISFDDDHSFEYVHPPISALKQPISEIAEKSVERLYSRIKESKSPGEHFILSSEFVSRDSH